MNDICAFIKQQKGSAVVEFAMVVVPFIISILFVMEMCRMVYIMSSVDVILAESGSAVSTFADSDDLAKNFQLAVNKETKNWPLLSTDHTVNAQVTFCESLEQVENSTCISTISAGKPLALYKISLAYHPIFFVFPETFISNIMSREIVLVQESQIDREVTQND